MTRIEARRRHQPSDPVLCADFQAAQYRLSILKCSMPIARLPRIRLGAGFGTAFDWDMDLLSGYRSRFLRNIAKHPGHVEFSGCDTPEIIPIIRGGKFDAVLVFGWYLKSFIQAIVAAKLARVPVLVPATVRSDCRRAVCNRLSNHCCFLLRLRVFDAALYVGERSRDYFETMAIRANGCSILRTVSIRIGSANCHGRSRHGPAGGGGYRGRLRRSCCLRANWWRLRGRST